MKTVLTVLRILLIMTLLTGLIYPMTITGITHFLVPAKAGGSIVSLNGTPRGSSLIAQKFTMERYFWPRPSACDYSTVPSGGENRGLTNRELKESYDDRMKYWISVIEKDENRENNWSVPGDMLFASGSGLDPHISQGSAYMQMERVARSRGFSQKQVLLLKELIEKRTEKPILGFIGQPVINVLLLNIDLDGMR